MLCTDIGLLVSSDIIAYQKGRLILTREHLPLSGSSHRMLTWVLTKHSCH